MRIYSINAYMPNQTTGKSAQDKTKQYVSFGFGEDYGDDSFLYDSPNTVPENSFLEYLGDLVSFPVIWVGEVIKEKRDQKRYEEDPDSFKYDPNELDI